MTILLPFLLPMLNGLCLLVGIIRLLDYNCWSYLHCRMLPLIVSVGINEPLKYNCVGIKILLGWPVGIYLCTVENSCLLPVRIIKSSPYIMLAARLESLDH